MARVLVSGLSVGNDFGVCDTCGFDSQWLVQYPSVILWVDKILLTTSTWDSVLRGAERTDSPFRRSTSRVLQMLRSAGLVEVVDVRKVLSKDIGKAIISSVESDVKALVEQFPEVAKRGDDEKVPGQVFLGEVEYCAPYLYSVYASLLAARVLDAQCLFDYRVLKYCNYKFGLGPRPLGTQTDRIESFHSVFQSLFPNEPLLPKYVLHQGYNQGTETCEMCRDEKTCSDSYLAQVEAQVKMALAMRDREEVEESRVLINRIIDKNSSGGRIDAGEVKEEFFNECNRLSRRSRRVFAKTKYWCSLSMILSVPLTVAGFLTQAPALQATCIAAMSAATGVKHLMDSLQEKYRWTAYFNTVVPTRNRTRPTKDSGAIPAD